MLYQGYTFGMKTAVSLPDALYEEAEKMASALGIPRSKLYAQAIEEFLKKTRNEYVTEKYNEVYARIGVESSSTVEHTGVENLQELTRNDSW